MAITPVVEVPVTFDVAMASRSVALEHRDPADRFIVASVKVFDLTLVTADERLLRCPDIDVIAQPLTAARPETGLNRRLAA